MILPQAPPLTPSDNPVHISDVTDTPVCDEDVDMELEEEIEHYMLHLTEENDSIAAAQANKSDDLSVPSRLISVLQDAPASISASEPDSTLPGELSVSTIPRGPSSLGSEINPILV